MTLSVGPAIAVDAAAWFTVQAAAGYLVHLLPDRALAPERWLFRERRWEGNGRLYTGVFRVRRWKALLPEGGAVFRGGFDKRRLASWDTEYLGAYARETSRAELGHWLAIVATPLFFLWNPSPLAWFMPVYAVAVNGPCIVSQRFNRLRLQRVAAAGRMGHGGPPRRAHGAGEERTG